MNSTIANAIYRLYSNVTHIIGEVAYDKDNNEVEYDTVAVENKIAELKAEEEAVQQAAEKAKASALAKLTKLGLTADEITALTGN